MPAQLHGSQQRISSLAKEARDVQPGLIKDSTMMRPAVSDRPPLATEAHPNPSIPEEDGVRGKAYVHLFPFCKSMDKMGDFMYSAPNLNIPFRIVMGSRNFPSC